jgi:hypothetical protein
MVRKFVAMFIGLSVVALCLAVHAAEDKTPAIKDVMKAVAGKEGLCTKCNAAAKGEKWEDAQKLSKKLIECGKALVKNKCPKGYAESWTKLTKQYSEQTVAINKAAEDKDSKAFSKAIGAFTGSCRTCHDAHK